MKPIFELRFDDRVAVITGAGRGLGRAYALLRVSKGAKVVVNVLIHNAGNVRRGSLKDMTCDDFDAVLNVHLRGAFHVARPAFPVMCKAGYGRVVLTSSISGLYGNHGVANYSASKTGMIGLSNVVALEGAAEGVKCNLIVPAAVTRMAEGIDTSAYPPMGPELVAPAVGWLAHESCSITGEMLVAIGGRLARPSSSKRRACTRRHGRSNRYTNRLVRSATQTRRGSARSCPRATSTISVAASRWPR